MELSLAIDKGYTIVMLDGYLFKTAPVMKSYSEFFLGLKREAEAKGDVVTRTVAKLCANSGYGKFGSSYQKSTTAVVNSDGLKFLETLYTIESIMEVDTNLFVVSHSTKPLIDSTADKDTLSKA